MKNSFIVNVPRVRGSRELVIWGTSENSVRYSGVIQRYSPISFYVSRDYDKLTEYMGLRVMCKDVLSPEKHYVIVLAGSYYPEIRKDLEEKGFAEYLDYLDWWRRDMNEDCIPKLASFIYANGYSFSQYFIDIGVKQLSIYCQWGSANPVIEQICFDIALNLDPTVKFWLSDENFLIFFPNQNLTAHSHFCSEDIDRITESDSVFVLFSGNVDNALSRIYTKTSNIYHILDILPDIWWRAIMSQGFRKIRELFPYLPIILFPESQYPSNRSAYSDSEKRVEQEMPGHYSNSILPMISQVNAVIPKTYEGFGYSVEEITEMLDTTRSHIDGKKIRLKDFAGNKVNISNGHRIVPGQPQNYKRTIYFFGGCITFGAGCPDEGTSSAHLQKLLNDESCDAFCVENYGMFISSRGKYVFETMRSIQYKPGDILISSFYSGPFENLSNPPYMPNGVFYLDLLKLFERPHDFGDNIFFDQEHPNEKGQFVIASKLFQFLKEHDFFCAFKDIPVSDWENSSQHEPGYVTLLDSYIDKISSLRPKIGSIVMNSNPFTLGHRYLVEYASKKCSHLFVFVVEEDKSDFSFNDRIEMVRLGTRDIPNVTVLPSGNFIISSLTFVDYFGKSEMQDRVIDPSFDVELFGKYIAPRLGINIRFAGEEPFDNVTRQYNETMKKVLPNYGVEFEVIPRKETAGCIISASRVRELLKTSQFGDIEKLVPATTSNYLLSASILKDGIRMIYDDFLKNGTMR